MATGCVLSLLLLLVATIILFVMTGPPGWILAGLFAIGAVVVTLNLGCRLEALGIRISAEDEARS